MSIRIKKDNRWRPIQEVYIYQQNTWKLIKCGYFKQGNSWQNFWQNTKIVTNNTPQTSINIYDVMGQPKHKGNFIFINNAKIIANNGEIALITGQFPAGSNLTIINNSYIIGHGGNGGSLYQDIICDGGDAICLETPCSLDNNNGYIFGGGGGGGGVKLIFTSKAGASSGVEYMYLSGSGGFPNGTSQIDFIRTGSNFISKNITEPQNPPNIKEGSLYISFSSSMYCTVASGIGGSYGKQGQVSRKINDTLSSPGGLIFKVDVTTMAGGKAGLAINKNGHEIMLINTDPERIKGAIA